MKNNFLVTILGIVMLVFFGCSNDNTEGNDFVAVTGISGISPVAEVNKPLRLVATVSPPDATNQTITWSVKSAGTKPVQAIHQEQRYM